MSIYYASDNGIVTCPSHGGMYFTSELERNPKLKTVRTPITTVVVEVSGNFDIALGVK